MLEQLTALHAYIFFGMASLLAILELIAPARTASTPVTQRWRSNIGLCLINLSLYRLFVPITAIAFSQYTLSQGGGLLQSLNVSGFLLVIFGFLLLDFFKYVEHRFFHSLTPLWRLHLIHHSDTDVDFTTTERHHPLEHALGISIVFGSIYLFGISPLSVIIYLLAGTAVAFVSHANLRFSSKFDEVIAYLLVTPRYHGIHHSPNKNKTNSNYGLVLTIWDRLFNTFNDPKTNTTQPFMAGLEYYREPQDGTLTRLLYLPFLPLPSIALTEITSDKVTD